MRPRPTQVRAPGCRRAPLPVRLPHCPQPACVLDAATSLPASCMHAHLCTCNWPSLPVELALLPSAGCSSLLECLAFKSSKHRDTTTIMKEVGAEVLLACWPLGGAPPPPPACGGGKHCRSCSDVVAISCYSHCSAVMIATATATWSWLLQPCSAVVDATAPAARSHGCYSPCSAQSWLLQPLQRAVDGAAFHRGLAAIP